MCLNLVLTVIAFVSYIVTSVIYSMSLYATFFTSFPYINFSHSLAYRWNVSSSNFIDVEANGQLPLIDQIFMPFFMID